MMIDTYYAYIHMKNNPYGEIPVSDAVKLEVHYATEQSIENIWDAFVSKERLEKWYGPPHGSTHITSFDFAVGGQVLMCITFLGGQIMWEKWTYTEIKPFEQISLRAMITDEQGEQPIQMGNVPAELINTFSFHVKNAGVEIKLTSEVLDPKPAFLSSFGKNKPHMEHAWLGSLQKIG